MLRFEAFLIKLLQYLVSLATSFGIKAILAFKVCLSTLHFKQGLPRRSLSSVAGSPHLSETFRQFSVPVNIQCSQDVDSGGNGVRGFSSHQGCTIDSQGESH